MWLQHHVLVDDGIKDEVTNDFILRQASETEQPVDPTTAEDEDRSLGEESGLFAAYCKRQKRKVCGTSASQLSHYLDICEGQNNLLFWTKNRNNLPSLFRVAMRVLVVTASSAPHGGIILWPHRSQM
ncbi:unnamed protein product, partial [Coregonus sp. 'balchen']